MPSFLEGIQKRARGLGKMAEELGAKAGKAIDNAVEPTVRKLNTKAYQDSEAAGSAHRLRKGLGKGR